jgi:3-keto-disaccharide hydrolase
MQKYICVGLLLCSAAIVSAEDLFNGKDLSGWEGNPALWSVKDGAITGQTTKENPTKGNTFLIYTNGNVDDFELRLSYKIVGGNSGIQYRSKVIDKKNWVVSGYQADIDSGTTYSGILYEEAARGILAKRGEKVVIKEAEGKPKIEAVGSLGKSDDIQKKIKNEEWNDYVVIAKGNHFQHFINGTQTIDVIDEQKSKAAKSGILALQLHAGPPMTVQFKNIRIKPLK